MSSSGPGPLLPSDIGKGGGVSFWARRLPGEIKRDLGFVRGPAPGRVVAAQPGTTSAGIASFNGKWNGQAYGCIVQLPNAGLKPALFVADKTRHIPLKISVRSAAEKW